MILANIWCSKCDCYRVRVHGWEADADRRVTGPYVPTPITREPSLRPHMCDVCRVGECYVDTRLCHPERSTVTADWLEKRVRPAFLHLSHAETASMTLKQWEEYHEDKQGYVGRLDGCAWALT